MGRNTHILKLLIWSEWVYDLSSILFLSFCNLSVFTRYICRYYSKNRNNNIRNIPEDTFNIISLIVRNENNISVVSSVFVFFWIDIFYYFVISNLLIHYANLPVLKLGCYIGLYQSPRQMHALIFGLMAYFKHIFVSMFYKGNLFVNGFICSTFPSYQCLWL